MGYDKAYDYLYAAVEPSDQLVDEWNATTDAEDWAEVRSVSGRLANSLRELQTTVLAADWPADARDAAFAFATALEQEIDWYSFVSIAADDGATMAALDQPWTDDAITASDELWSILEAGLASAG